VTVINPKQVDFGTTGHHDRACVTASGKRKGNVKVALNPNQVKSLQGDVHADGGPTAPIEAVRDLWQTTLLDLDISIARKLPPQPL
jgi:hypothetical protein